MPDTDVLIIGAGAAGLMAAGQSAAAGARTLVLEKMPRPARKLCITGKGRCNLTNIAPVKDFLDHFPAGRRFLRNAFARFFSNELIAFFHSIGIATVTERGGRVFPVSNRALDVVDALEDWAGKQSAHIRTSCSVHELLLDSERVVGVLTAGGERITAPTVILAAGGSSYPGTGSTGDGYALARAAGHTVNSPRPSLVPLETAGNLAPRLQGLSLKNVRITLWADGRKQTDAFGEMLFTHFGLSGPAILTLSRTVVDLMQDGMAVELSIDLKPALDDQKLDARLQRELSAHGKMKLANLLKSLLPQKLIPVCLEQTGAAGDKPAHQVTGMERKHLRLWLKDFRFQVTAHRGMNEAIVTAGGVDTREIDPKTMASRKVKGLYLCGEVLDVDADTGGYNLQAAFSTGWLAGRSAAEAVLDPNVAG